MKEDVFESSGPLDYDWSSFTTTVGKGTICEVIFSKKYVEESVCVIPEVHSLVRAQRLDRVSEIEVLDIAIECAEERHFLSWPLLLHVIWDAFPKKCIPILVSYNDRVAFVVLHSHLDCNPLVVWDIDLLRDRFIVILVGKEEEARRVPAHQIEHEYTFNFD